jgi:hypothetical protein
MIPVECKENHSVRYIFARARPQDTRTIVLSATPESPPLWSATPLFALPGPALRDSVPGTFRRRQLVAPSLTDRGKILGDTFFYYGSAKRAGSDLSGKFHESVHRSLCLARLTVHQQHK